MANRNLSSNSLTFDRKIVTLWARVNIGATGAPTLQKFDHVAGSFVNAPTGGTDGIKSVTRNSAGNYTFVLQDSYVGLLAAWVGFAQDASPAASNTHTMATGTNVRSATSPQVTIQTRAAAVATDPASGEVMIIEIELTDSTAQ